VNDLAEVTHLFLALVHRHPMREVDEVRAVSDKGFEGCIHGRPASKRQVLVMELETLDRLGVKPGEVRENITTFGVNLQDLATGDRLRIGEAVLEVTGPCHPCSRMDEIREGLQDKLRGQRGVLCRVVQEGILRRGDEIEVVTRAGEEIQTG
jgi:MOSC domain-containing protein YiiM